jgi:hypothetical protein
MCFGLNLLAQLHRQLLLVLRLGGVFLLLVNFGQTPVGLGPHRQKSHLFRLQWRTLQKLFCLCVLLRL